MINNKEDMVFFLGLKVFNFNTYYMYCCMRNAQVNFCRESTVEKNLFSEI